MSRFAVERSESRDVSWPNAPEFDQPQVLARWGDTVNRVAVERVERRVGLRLFGRWFGYESSTTQRRADTVQLTRTGPIAIAPPAPRGSVALAGGGVLAIALLGGAIGALLVPTTPQAASGVPLLTTLPESRPIAMQPMVATPQRPITPRAALAAVPIAVTAAAATTVPGSMAIDGDIATDSNALSLSQARATALASGEPAYWAEGARNGVVVAGPEHAESGQLCRLVAIFTRVEDDRGSTQSTTQCRPPSVTGGKPN